MRFLLLLFGFAVNGLAAPPLPSYLEATGLGEPGTIEFTPRHALWSDGSAKRRWLQLPPGATVDKSNPDAWEFPRGTKAWKEFSRGGRRIETRYIERLADGSWRFAVASGAIRPGTLRLVAGDVLATGADAVVFRLQGRPGERVVFTFETQ